MQNILPIQLPDEMEEQRKSHSAHPFQFISEIGFINIKTARALLFSEDLDLETTDPIYPVILAARGKLYSLEGNQEKALKLFKDGEQAAIQLCCDGQHQRDVLAYTRYEYGAFLHKLQYRNTASIYFKHALQNVKSHNFRRLMSYNHELIQVQVTNSKDTKEVHRQLTHLKKIGYLSTYLLGKRILAIHEQKLLKVELAQTLERIDECNKVAQDSGYEYLADVLELGVGLAYGQANSVDDAKRKCLELFNRSKFNFVKALSL